MKKFVLALCCILAVLILPACGSSGNFTEKSTWNDLGFDYNLFARNPDEHQEEEVTFIGKIFYVGVFDGTLSNQHVNDIYEEHDYGQTLEYVRLAPGWQSDDSGKYVTVLYFPSDYPQRFLDDDIIKVTGVFWEFSNSSEPHFFAKDIVLQ